MRGQRYLILPDRFRIKLRSLLQEIIINTDLRMPGGRCVICNDDQHPVFQYCRIYGYQEDVFDVIIKIPFPNSYNFISVGDVDFIYP